MSERNAFEDGGGEFHQKIGANGAKPRRCSGVRAAQGSSPKK
jgi:hypothetical protein